MDLVVGDLVISLDEVIHPLLGEAFVICDRAGEPLTAMSAVNLDRPTEIPIIAEPAKLPPGAGALLLNRIAERAPHPLRYAGPYPTPALYHALLRSFRASADEEIFTRDLVGRMARLARDPVPVDFAPAPHRRVPFARGFTEVRDGVERAVIDGVAYEVRANRAELYFAGVLYAIIAELAPDGTLVAGPATIPPLHSEVIGKAFPAALRTAIAELLAELVPAPLAAAARSLVAEAQIVWADLGARTARRTETGFEVHAAIWQLGAPRGMAHVAMHLATALAPAATATLVSQLTS